MPSPFDVMQFEAAALTSAIKSQIFDWNQKEHANLLHKIMKACGTFANGTYTLVDSKYLFGNASPLHTLSSALDEKFGLPIRPKENWVGEEWLDCILEVRYIPVQCAVTLEQVLEEIEGK